MQLQVSSQGAIGTYSEETVKGTFCCPSLLPPVTSVTSPTSMQSPQHRRAMFWALFRFGRVMYSVSYVFGVPSLGVSCLEFRP